MSSRRVSGKWLIAREIYAIGVRANFLNITRISFERIIRKKLPDANECCHSEIISNPVKRFITNRYTYDGAYKSKYLFVFLFPVRFIYAVISIHGCKSYSTFKSPVRRDSLNISNNENNPEYFTNGIIFECILSSLFSKSYIYLYARLIWGENKIQL